jgi:hypothetical protein
VAARTFSLSIHADYACRHSGACCTAGWTIPVEAAIRRVLPVEVLHPSADGACPEYDRAARLCRIHRDYGEPMLPESCYHFPRRALADARGTFVTLTHFCPTAAWQLFRDDVDLEITEDPPAFPPLRDYDPLDGRSEWPPLLRPTVLFDLESYSRWERFIVDSFANPQPVGTALETIAGAAERLRNWSPEDGPLAAHVETTVRSTPAEPGTMTCYRPFAEPTGYQSIVETIPDGLAHPDLPSNLDVSFATYVVDEWPRWSTPIRRFLAAKAFGSWSAYQGRGVRTLVAELVASEMVVRVEAARACGGAGRALDEALLHQAIRQADWLLMHLADRAQFLRWLGQVEDR